MKFGDLEVKLERLPSVISCKIAPWEAEIDEVHILAKENEPEAKIVDEIKTAILADKGIEISNEQISIAQVESPKEEKRNRIEIISVYKERNNPVCHYKLKINDKIIEDQFSQEENATSPHLVAAGLLNVIGDQLGLKEKIELENVFIAGSEDNIIIVQVISYMGDGFNKKLRLLGASYIDFNLPLATAKACLKALNRQFSIYL
jgi:small basic protein